jgi:hypothetical protein
VRGLPRVLIRESQNLEPGKYSLIVKVVDRVGNRTLEIVKSPDSPLVASK